MRKCTHSPPIPMKTAPTHRICRGLPAALLMLGSSALAQQAPAPSGTRDSEQAVTLNVLNF
jgi:hypothetical protein